MSPGKCGPCEKSICVPCQDEVTGHPVRYFNGEIALAAQDLSSSGFGQGWGHRRVYSNRLSSETDFGNGYDWMISALPYLFDQPNDLVVAVFDSREAFWFDLSGESYVARHGLDVSLAHDAANGVFRLTYADGTVWEFYDLQPDADHPGRFKKVTVPGGQTTEAVDYTADHHVAEVQRSSTSGGVTTDESYLYDYAEGSDGEERIQSITLRRRVDQGAWENVERVLYTYYTGASGDSFGSLGDLKTATHQHLDDSAWVADAVHYYRYWTSGQSNGFVHGLKYVVNPAAYAALAADPAVADPLTASDAQVAQYADHYFEYNSDYRVTRERVEGGALETTLTYVDGTHANGYNHWKRKTTETRDDGSQTIVYTNYMGQILLRERVTSDGSAIEFNEYDDDSRLLVKATPSAIDSYVDDAGAGGNELSVTWRSEAESYTVGLAYLNEYYAATDLEEGAVAGYLAYEKIRKGRDSTPILLRKYEYTGHTATPDASRSSSSSSSGASGPPLTVYPVSKVTVYRNEDGSGPIETAFSYLWHPDTVQMLQRVITLPAVPTDQNGSGVSATRTERFDDDGNLVWLRDERGTITHYEYDLALGVVTQRIDDVDGSQLTLPEGWSTPTGGGLHLVTDYEHDNRARLTQTLGPEHSVDLSGVATTVRTASWTVYRDAAYEIWSAQGYATGTSPDYTYTLVNPVSITKYDVEGNVQETIRAVRASTSGKLSASDSFPQSSYVRWTTYQYDTYLPGRPVSSRVYHAIPESGDGEEGTNYAESTYGYDAMGRRNRQTAPGGTITRSVFDDQDRPVCVYVGTDDTGATDSDPSAGREPCSEAPVSSSSSSSSAASTNNMVLVTEYAYHGAGGCSGCCGGGSGLLATTIQHVSESAFRVTEYLYDWRNRQQYVLSDADDQDRHTFARTDYDNLNQTIKSERYHDVDADGVDADSDPNPDDLLISRSETFFDDLGRVYQSAITPVVGGTPGTPLVADSWYDDAGSKIASEDPLGRRTEWEYDSLGRLVQETLPDPDDEGQQLAPWSTFVYDEAGNLLATTDRLDHTTTFGYDALGRRVSATDPNGGVTHFAFDAAGNMASLTDPVGNTTQWSFDHAGRVVEEENQLGASRYFAYNADGDLVQKTDRNGRVTEYDYDLLRRRISETWQDGEETIRSFSFTYNLPGEMLTASDPAASYTFVYDNFGRAVSITHEIAGLTPAVVMSQQYDLLGPRSQVAATLGGAADFATAYALDGLGRVSRIEQSGVTGGHAVAGSRVDLSYDDANQFATITRYNNLAGTQTVAQSPFTFDNTGRLINLAHAKGQTTLASHAWTFDAASRVTAYTNSADGSVAYTNDAASQLTVAIYTYQPPVDDEAYVYDANGNRTNNGYTVGQNNRLTSDGTNTYTYDDEGNRLTRTNTSTGAVTEYTWDHRNRLTTVTERDSANGPATKITHHTYDHQNRWLTRTVHPDGDTGNEPIEQAVFVYDGYQIVLHFSKTGAGDLAAADLTHRYLWGPTTDQILSDEQVTSLETLGTRLWPLCDHLNTVRDLAVYDSGTDTTTITNHRVFDAYGRLTSETNAAVDCLFTFTSQAHDDDIGVQNNLNPWYDPAVGRWMSEAPIGAGAGDANSYRYAKNGPATHGDASGAQSFVAEATTIFGPNIGYDPVTGKYYRVPLPPFVEPFPPLAKPFPPRVPGLDLPTWLLIIPIRPSDTKPSPPPDAPSIFPPQRSRPLITLPPGFPQIEKIPTTNTYGPTFQVNPYPPSWGWQDMSIGIGGGPIGGKPGLSFGVEIPIGPKSKRCP